MEKSNVLLCHFVSFVAMARNLTINKCLNHLTKNK